MANSAEPGKLASSEANWSGSTLFAKAGHIRIQQDKGWACPYKNRYLQICKHVIAEQWLLFIVLYIPSMILVIFVVHVW